MNGKKHGWGEAIYSNGSRYIGQYKDGVMHGYGYYVGYNCESKYLGWLDGAKK